MRLIRHGGDFANPIGDADGVDRLHRAQAREAAVVVAGAVADAMAAPVEAGERHEQEIRLDGGRVVRAARECPCAPSAVGSPGRHRRKVEMASPRPTTAGSAVAKPSPPARRAGRACRARRGSDGRRRRPPAATGARAAALPRTSRSVKAARASPATSALRRASASRRRSAFGSGVGRGQGGHANPSEKGAEPRRPLDGDPGRLRK